MRVDLDPEVVALLARLAAVREIPCDGIFANAVLGASLREIVPQAERADALWRSAEAARKARAHG